MATSSFKDLSDTLVIQDVTEGSFKYSEETDSGMKETGIVIDGTKVGKALSDVQVDGDSQSAILSVSGGYSLTVSTVTLSNGYKDYTKSDANGAAVLNAGSFTATASTFSGNTSGLGGAIYNNETGDALVSGSLFENNYSVQGGAIDDGGKLTVQSSTFSANTSVVRGGAIMHFSDEKLLITGSTFSNNLSDTEGGAIAQMSDGDIELQNSVFVKNSAHESSGAIFFTGGTLTLHGNTFTENETPTGGGGAVAFDGLRLDVADSVFSGNLAKNGAGGALSAKGVSIVTNSTFKDNIASMGGAVMNVLGSMFRCNGNTFTGNTASAGGAFENGSGASLDATASIFTGNVSTDNGGAVSNEGGNIYFSGSSFSANSAAQLGGVMYSDEGYIRNTKNSYSANTASKGGVFSISDGDFQETGSVFSRNSAANGGALFISGASTVSVAESKFSSNIATGNGGAVMVSSGTVTFDNDSFTENRASKGGAIYGEAASVINVVNSVFSNNDGAINTFGTITVKDTIFETRKDTVYSAQSISFSGQVATSANITSDAGYSFAEDSVLVFSLVSYAGATDKELLSDYSKITNPENVTFCVDVSADQTGGSYVLVSNASTFGTTQKVNVALNEVVIGSAGLGETVYNGVFKYTLNLDDQSNLALFVGECIAPTIDNITVSPLAWTNGKVTVTAQFNDNDKVATKQYSLDGGTSWSDYTYGVLVGENTTVTFKAVDASGNETTKSVDVTNIDTVKPVFDKIEGNVTNWTQGNVTITVEASDAGSDVKSLEYSLDGVTWKAYQVAGITVSENTDVFLRVTDNAGNVTTHTESVTKIDKDAPAVAVEPSTSEWTKQSVVLNVSAVDMISGVKNIEVNAGSGWSTLSGTSFAAATNGTYQFRATDNAGNVSAVQSVEVMNIDTGKPTVVTGSIKANITTPTNGNVIVYADYADAESGVAKIQFSLDGSNWSDYAGGVVVAGNGTVSFKALDKVGNESTVSTYEVSNIDKDAPTVVITTGDVSPSSEDVTLTVAITETGSGVKTKQYSIDGTNWTDIDETGKILVSKNSTVYVKVTDKAGNVTEQAVNVGNIDKIAPSIAISGNISSWAKSTTIFATATDEGGSGLMSFQYSLDNGSNWTNYTDGVKMNTNGDIIFKATDNAGNMTSRTVTVTNIDTVKPVVTAVADTTEFTNGNVKVSISITETGSGVKTAQYSLDQVYWYDYSDGMTMTANGTVYFKAVDWAENESEIASYTVSNIDKDAPTISNITATSATWTDKVTVTATFADTGVSGFATASFSLDGETWNSLGTAAGTYATPQITENGTVYLKATDNAGNETIQSVVISNIDKAAPTITVYGNPDHWTNENVTLSVEFTDDASGVATKQYSYDNTAWIDYTTPIVVEANKTIYFRSTDVAGKTATSSVNVTKIDKFAPVIDAASDISDWTNQNVRVTADFSKEAGSSKIVLKQYSYDQLTWTDYTDVANLTFEKNGSVFFRATDEAGNVTVQEYKVDNIDKVAPTFEGAALSTTEWTNGSVLVAASFNDLDVQGPTGKEGSGVYAIEYSLDNGSTWKAYSTGVKVDKNDTNIKFRATDRAGNSTVSDAVVTNIDTVAPVFSKVEGNPTAWTKGSVTITVTAADPAAVSGVSGQSGVKSIEYSLDGFNWSKYESGITVTENGEVRLRVTDNAGNVTTRTEVVSKIDNTAPVLSTIRSTSSWTNRDVVVTLTATDLGGSGVKGYQVSTDNGANWTDVKGEVYSILKNGTYQFRATDMMGNISDVSTVEIDNIDTLAPVFDKISGNPTDWTKSDVTITVEASDPAAVPGVSGQSGVKSIEYSLDGFAWYKYEDGVTLKDNGSVAFRVTDNAGNVTTRTETVSKIDKTGPTLTVTGNTLLWTNQNVTLKLAAVDLESGVGGYQVSLDGGLNWTDVVGNTYSAIANGTYLFRATDKVGNTSDTVTVEIENIDKVAPTVHADASTTSYTNKNVTVSIITGDSVSGVASREYSFDQTHWYDYSEGVVFTENGTVYFRATDNAGNVSDTVSFDVQNIDKIAPTIGVATMTPTDWTKQNVTVKVPFADEGVSGLSTCYYSYDGINWTAFALVEGVGTLVTDKNAVIQFKATDNAGNVTVSEVIVGNIDRDEPTLDKYRFSTKDWTNQSVVVYASYDDETSGVKKIQYALNGSLDWMDYDNGVVVKDNNTTVSFRAIDYAGNISKTTDCDEIIWIDTLPGTIQISSTYEVETGVTSVWATVADAQATTTSGKSGLASVMYSVNGYDWSNYNYNEETGVGEVLPITVNETVYFRITDKAGNITTRYEYITGAARELNTLEIPRGLKYVEPNNLTYVEKITLNQYSILEGLNVSMSYRKNYVTIHKYGEFHVSNLYTFFYDQDDNDRSIKISMESYTNFISDGMATCIRSFSTNSYVNFTVGSSMTGTKDSNTFSFGSYNVVKLGSINMKTGQNTLKFAKNADVTVTENMENIKKLYMSSAVTVKDDWKVKHQTFSTLNVGGDYIYSKQYNATIELLNYVNVNIQGDVRNADNYTCNLTLKIGKNSSFSAKSISYLKSLNLTSGAAYMLNGDDDYKTQGYTTLTAGDVYGSDKDDSIKLGNFSTMTVSGIYLQAGKDKITLSGRCATLNVSDNIVGFASLSISGGSTNTNVYKVKELQYSEVNVGGYLMGYEKSTSVSVGKYAKLTAKVGAYFLDGNDTIKMSDRSTVLIGELSFGLGSNKLTVGKECELAITGTISEFFDMTIDKNSMIFTNDDMMTPLSNHIKKVASGVQFFSLGTAEQASVFQGTEFEDADNDTDSESVLGNGAKGWLSANSIESVINRYDDTLDFFKLDGVAASNLSKVTIEGEKLQVSVWAKLTDEEPYTKIADGIETAEGIWTFEDVTQDVKGYLVEVTLDGDTRVAGGIATYQITIA